MLAKNAGKVLTHHQLLREVWGPNPSNDTQYLGVSIGQLRPSSGTSSRRASRVRGTS